MTRFYESLLWIPHFFCKQVSRLSPQAVKAALERIAHELEIKVFVGAEMLDENIPKRMGERPISTVIGFAQVPSETETCGAIILAQYENDERIIGSAADEDWEKFARVLSTLPRKRIEIIVNSLAKDEADAYKLGEILGKLDGRFQKVVIEGMASRWPSQEPPSESGEGEDANNPNGAA